MAAASKVKRWAGAKDASADDEAREAAERLRDFASACKAKAHSAGENSPYRFNRNKVFLAILDLSKPGRESLWRAHQQGLLKLSRCDLAPALTAEQRQIMARSEMHFGPGEFHLIDA